MTFFEWISLCVNLVAITIAGFTASLAWRDFQTKRQTPLPDLAQTRAPVSTSSISIEDYISLVVAAVKRLSRQSFTAHVGIMFSSLAVILAVVFAGIYLRYGGIPRPPVQPSFDFFALFFGPVVAGATIVVYLEPRMQRRISANFQREMHHLLSDSKLNPQTAESIVQQLAQTRAGYANAVLASILALRALSTRYPT